MLNSEEIKAVAIAIIELCLSKGISKGGSKSVSQSVNQSVEIRLNRKFLKFRRNGFVLKTFLSLAMPNLYCLDVTK